MSKNLTPAEVAPRLRCAVKTVQRMCLRKDLAPTFKVGGEYRIPETTVEAFERGETAPTKPARRGAWRPRA